MKQMGVILTVAAASAVGSPLVATATGDPLSRTKADVADGKVMLVDAVAARKPGADTTVLRSLLQAARTQAKEFRSAVQSAFAEARRAAKQDRGSKGSECSSSSRGSDEDGSGG